MTIKCTKYFGVHFRVMRGADDSRYLTCVIWYPRSKRQLGYLYPSIRLPG